MNMEGDGPQDQPAEGVASLESLAAMLGSEEAAPDESEGGDAAEESEGSEDADAEEGESSDEGEDAEEATFTIKHDGKEVTLKQSELIELGQQGFDYTKKTMALAEKEKALEPIRAEVEQRRQQALQAVDESAARLSAIVEFMQSELGEAPPVEWASQDAGYYIAQKELYESRKGKLEKAQYALQQTQQEQARSRQAALHSQIAETQKALKDTLPDWSSAKEDELAAFVGELGLTPDKAEMAFWKPGFWQIAHEAKAYRALMAEKAKLKPVNTLPKVHKPGNPQPPQLARHQEAIKAHRAKPTLDSLSKLL
jgi:small-conductance mechanosensitive channel